MNAHETTVKSEEHILSTYIEFFNMFGAIVGKSIQQEKSAISKKSSSINN
ncbi:MAG: hypothetical protein HWD61_11955 [Parachlamydiaceae bacterium]|nr:MAG: hypothetical protein HWD61_11955 [Parachlamydiaceae bacterium]